MITKFVRMKMTTWREIRHLFPGKRNETTADYLERFVDDIIIKAENDMELPPIRKEKQVWKA